MKPKLLTYAEARELKWFCKNVIGVRSEMYNAMEKVNAFDEKIKRLEKTCELIEKFLGEKIEAHTPVDWASHESTSETKPQAREMEGDK